MSVWVGMEDAGATLHGECAPWPAKEQLASILTKAGFNVDVGAYSVRLCGDPDFSLSFEHYGGDICDPSVVADAIDAVAMIKGARLVSAALTAADIRHRLVVYDGTGQDICYLNHDWPPTPFDAAQLQE